LKLLDAIARRVPLAVYKPFRIGVVSLRRSSLRRKVCVVVLKLAARAHRGHLAARLPDVRPLDAPQLVFRSVDSMVMDAVYWFGVKGYEGRVADVWVALCSRAGAVLEIGGNVGLFTVIGAHACVAPYTVVEPVPAIAAVLHDNLARNGLTRVEILQAAAIPGTVPTEVTLNIPDEGRSAPVGSHLTEGVEVQGRSSRQRIRVMGRPFRDLIAGRDLVKIDAEGIEAKLLESARDIILAERPTLLIEILPSATQLAALVTEFARAAGYAIHILPEWGSDTVVTVAADAFTAALPARFNSKDIVLSTAALPV
jgi:FkbM family methyltransferase